MYFYAVMSQRMFIDWSTGYVMHLLLVGLNAWLSVDMRIPYCRFI